MADFHYSVDTSHGKVEFDSPRSDLSPAEISQVINQNHPAASGFDVPSGLQGIADVVTMPGRGLRGIGVGLEQMLMGKGLQPALQRATAATQPGYQAQPGEKLGSFAGGMADPLTLAANAVLPGGSLLKSIGSGAMMAAGNSALDQAAQGHVNPNQVGLDMAMGGATGGLTHGIANGAQGFLNKAQTIFKRTSGIPEQGTEIFKANPGIEKTVQGTEQAIEEKAQGVQDALKEMYQNAKAYFKKAAADPRVKANLSPAEKAKSTPIAAEKIPDAIDNIKNILPMIQKTQAGKTEATDATSAAFKTLLHIRQSIDHWSSYGGGQVPAVSSIQEGGLKELRPQVNAMIESLPGGEVLRDADKTIGAAKDIFSKLQPKMQRTGDAIRFLRDTFEMKGDNAKEDMMNLLALEKISGKPVVNDMFKALTMSHFSQNLAGNQISRSVAGASPFLISALLRVAGLPFQASLPISAAAVTALRSPKLQGMAVRGAQEYGPALSKLAKPTATAALAAIRQRWADEGQK